MLSFRRLSRANRQRCEESYFPLEDWTPSDYATALAGETGEACNLIAKMKRGVNIDHEDIGRELADVVIYADLLASRLGLNLEKCIIQKFNETSARKGSEVLL
ncbi:MAG: MazG-like family protein [Bacteroidota bacterium]